MNYVDRFNFWLYKKAPGVLTFIRQFTIMEWFVVVLLLGFIVEKFYDLV
jgi:hypothetical protein